MVEVFQPISLCVMCYGWEFGVAAVSSCETFDGVFLLSISAKIPTKYDGLLLSFFVVSGGSATCFSGLVPCGCRVGCGGVSERLAVYCVCRRDCVGACVRVCVNKPKLLIDICR